MNRSVRAARRGPRRRAAWALLAVATLLGGCATTYRQGASAYRRGDYATAAERFQAALAADPQRVDALVGLGLARYSTGDWPAATDTLERAVALAPRDATARLYLGLAHLRRGDDAQAVAHLGAFRDLAAGTRTAGQADRALRLIREMPMTPELRVFVAVSLEEASAMQHELAAALEALR
ncbi:MAG TPA: tetratricopeptide repeat protein, partial [Methylomirabilota bacterium]|nr:tetratricopeptide repeat protein [Methylomirabilota bacterium]